MIDIEELKQIAENIIKDNEVIKCYRELGIICENNQLYQEQAGCLERIANITKEPYLYEQMGNIFKNKLDNNCAAYAIYNKYLSLVLPDFYNNYSQTFDNDFKLPDTSKYNKDFCKIVDRYIALAYIIICLYKNEKYADILEFSKYLDSMNEKVNMNLRKVSKINKDFLSDIEDVNTHIANIFANIIDNLELNQIAIKLNKKCELAYLNIIYYYFKNKNFDKVIECYQDYYLKEFKADNETKLIPIMWVITQKYSELKKFFESTECQKMIIDMELEVKNEK